ncbi:MAG TPA: tetratricopeptide repeat protein, partial [Pyrinomonadaceae bacterium]|nr:tetratricopeptide repeat protein [Pyrinomonadaceae bacterium]
PRIFHLPPRMTGGTNLKKPARLILPLLIFVAASAVLAQGAHTLQGKVIAPNGGPPPQSVRVTLTYSGRPIYETFTDAGGHFSFTGLIRGTYELTAEGDDVNFETTRVTAELTAFGAAPQLFTQDIQLRALRGKPIGPAAVVNAFTQDVPKSAAEALEQGQKLDREGKRAEAVAKIREALRIFPSYFEAHLVLGNHFVKDGMFKDAIDELDRAREINPNDDRLYQSFGLIMIAQQNYRMAFAVLSEAARLNPKNPANPYLNGVAHLEYATSIDPAQSEYTKKDFDKALEDAERFLLNADDLSSHKLAEVHLQLARLYEKRGDNARAANELEEYLKKSPDAKNAEAIRDAIRKLKSAR